MYNKDKRVRLIKDQHYFSHAQDVDINGIKIELFIVYIMRKYHKRAALKYCI